MGRDSPAELFSEPCGTLSAGSILPNLWSAERGDWCESRCEKRRVSFAELKKDAALATEKPRCFFSPLVDVGVGVVASSPGLREDVAERGERRLSRSKPRFAVFRVRLVGPVAEDDGEEDDSTDVSAFSLAGLEPNILFSSPPCEASLRRLLVIPASFDDDDNNRSDARLIHGFAKGAKFTD